MKGYPVVLAFQFPGMLAGFISEIRAQYQGVTTRPKKKAATRNTVYIQQSRLTSVPHLRLNNKMVPIKINCVCHINRE